MNAEHIIKNTLLSDMNRQTSNSTVDKVISVYGRRSEKDINWNKLKTDINHLMQSQTQNKQALSSQIIKLVLENGLNYIYTSRDETSKQFRTALLKEKQRKFMQRVYNTFN